MVAQTILDIPRSSKQIMADLVVNCLSVMESSSVTRLYRLRLVITPMDDLGVYAGYTTSTGGFNIDVAHIGAEYTFLDYGYVGASYIDGGSSSSNSTNIKVGYNIMFGQY